MLTLLPIISSALYPKISSAAGLKESTRPFSLFSPHLPAGRPLVLSASRVLAPLRRGRVAHAGRQPAGGAAGAAPRHEAQQGLLGQEQQARHGQCSAVGGESHRMKPVASPIKEGLIDLFPFPIVFHRYYCIAHFSEFIYKFRSNSRKLFILPLLKQSFRPNKIFF